MTITAEKQVEFNGLALTDPTYEIQSIEGLAGFPDIRSADQPLLARHGLHAGNDLFDGRSVTITVVVHSATEQDFRDAVRALRTAFVPGGSTAKTLSFQLGGIADDEPARINCRTRHLALPMASDWWAGYAEATVELFATDPLIYSDSATVLATTLPESPEGLEWDSSWPRDWGGTSAAGSIFADNAGTVDAPAVIRIDGPVTDPRIENLAAGKTIELDITLAAGEFIVIDTGARTVLLGGTASRYSSLTADSRWWDLMPGSNEITFRASTPDTALLSLTWRSAWV